MALGPWEFLGFSQNSVFRFCLRPYSDFGKVVHG